MSFEYRRRMWDRKHVSTSLHRFSFLKFLLCNLEDEKSNLKNKYLESAQAYWMWILRWNIYQLWDPFSTNSHLVFSTLNFKLRLDEFTDAHIGQEERERQGPCGEDEKDTETTRDICKIRKGWIFIVLFNSICRLFVLLLLYMRQVI